MADMTWSELRRRAEDEVGLKLHDHRWAADPRRALYELEVNEVELRMQHEELQRAQVELARSADDYRLMFEHAPVAYLELDERTFVYRANRAAVGLLGLDEVPAREPALGVPSKRPLADHLTARSADALQRHLSEAARSGEHASCLVQLERPGRATVTVKLDTVPAVFRRGLRLRTVVTELPPSAVTAEVRASTRTVWVVDDDPGVREGVARMVRRMGYRTVVLENGQAVLEALERLDTPPDLLLTDVQMPALGGIELARRVRGQRPGTAVLFMSGHLGDEGLPPDGRLVHKPFSVERLRRELEALLEVG